MPLTCLLSLSHICVAFSASEHDPQNNCYREVLLEDEYSYSLVNILGFFYIGHFLYLPTPETFFAISPP